MLRPWKSPRRSVSFTHACTINCSSKDCKLHRLEMLTTVDCSGICFQVTAESYSCTHWLEAKYGFCVLSRPCEWKEIRTDNSATMPIPTFKVLQNLEIAPIMCTSFVGGQSGGSSGPWAAHHPEQVPTNGQHQAVSHFSQQHRKLLDMTYSSPWFTKDEDSQGLQ